MLFNKTKRAITDKAKKDDTPLEMVVSVALKRKSSNSWDDTVVSEISFTKVLQTTSDSKVKDILKEFGNHLEGVYGEAEQDINSSKHLSDGCISEGKILKGEED